MKKNFFNKCRISALLLSCSLLFILGGCSALQGGEEAEENLEYPVVIGDVEIMEKPLRVATLSPALTDMLVSLGLEGRIVAVSEGSKQYLTQTDRYDYEFIGTSLIPNTNRIAEVSPQVLFTSTTLTDDVMDKLHQNNIQVVHIEYGDDFESVYQNYRTILTVMNGNVSGNEMADEIINNYEEKLNSISTTNSTLSEAQSAIYMRAPLLTVATGDTFEQQFFDIWSISNWGEAYLNWSYPEDMAIELEPDIILYADEIDVSVISEASIYKTTASVVNSELYSVDYTSFDNQSARMFTEIERVSKHLYPEGYIVEIPEY